MLIGRGMSENNAVVSASKTGFQEANALRKFLLEFPKIGDVIAKLDDLIAYPEGNCRVLVVRHPLSPPIAVEL